MSTLFMAALALTAAPLGEPAANSKQAVTHRAAVAISPVELRRAVSSALRNEALARGTDRYAARVVLAERLRQLVDDTRMARGSRRRLITKVVNRLRKLDEAERRKILAQAGFPPPAQGGQAGGGGGAAKSAEALAELIRTVVAPESWVENGGNGSIVVFGR